MGFPMTVVAAGGGSTHATDMLRAMPMLTEHAERAVRSLADVIADSTSSRATALEALGQARSAIGSIRSNARPHLDAADDAARVLRGIDLRAERAGSVLDGIDDVLAGNATITDSVRVWERTVRSYAGGALAEASALARPR